MEQVQKELENKVLIISNQRERLLKTAVFNDPYLVIISPEELEDDFEILNRSNITIDASFTNQYFNFLTEQGLKKDTDSEARTEYLVYDQSRIYKGTDNLASFIKLTHTLKHKFTDAQPEEVKKSEFQKLIAKSKEGATYHLVRKMPNEKEEGINYITIEELGKLERVFDIIDSVVE